MIRQSRKRLHDVPMLDLIPLIEKLCHEEMEAYPIYECVKVYARLRSDNKITYARHRNDLGTSVVTASDIISRFKDEKIGSTVQEALSLVEEKIAPEWPFSPGSNSWIQLEILDNHIKVNGPINKPTIVLRKAVRFSSSKKEVTASSTPLLERMFTRLEGRIPAELGRFQVVCNPTFRLKNIAGTGVVTESMESVDSGASATKIAETAACHLIRDNLGHEPFISPGFCFTLDGVEYQVTSRTYGTVAGKKKVSKSTLPIPVVGVVR